MPTYTTPEPVALLVRFDSGQLTIIASDRTDTIVDVQPSKPSSDIDVEHAENTVVEQHGNQIRVIAPDVKKRFLRSPSIDVVVELPTRSDVTGMVAAADARVIGEIGSVSITTASGDVAVERSASCSISVASGDVACDQTSGDLAIKSASGEVRFTSVGGNATLTSASGNIFGLKIDGDVELRTASGDISIDWVGGSATARTASGDLRLAGVRRGTVEADSASGDLTIGVAEGSAAWLDVNSLTGDVSSSLEDSGPPLEGTDVVSIHARTLSGDIVIRRAALR